MSGPPPPNGPGDYDPNRPPPQYPPPHHPPPQWNGQVQPDDQQPPYQYPPPAASYPPPPDQERAYYPYPPPANMAAIHPHAQGQDPYRLPPPPGAYRPDAYGQPPAATQVVHHYQAAAPRQRTAIACRYCRRRKIRCSGFETSTDGRCTNCIRFNQECMFTPVSSQAQAFVPAQVAYPHLRNQQATGRGSNPGMTLYGAHGQPLPPQQQPETTLPPPPGMYGHPYARPMDGAPPPLASGIPDPRQPGRRGSGSGFDYPDPTNANLAPVTPVSTPGYQAHTAPSPYYPPPHDRRTSPQSAYAYDARHSSSPHSSPYPPMAQGGPTPPPTSTPGAGGGSARSGLNVRDMLNPGGNDSHGRSSTDSDMLNALNRRGPQ